MAHSESLDLLLLGRSGNGKSATGNSILGGNYFTLNRTTSPSANSEPAHGSNTIGGKIVRVVDGVDLGGGDESLIGEQISRAMSLINNCVSAFLIVVRCDLPYSNEEASALAVLKTYLGKDVIKNFGICIATRGDSFLIDEDEKKLDFETWCKKGQHNLHALFKECNYRCVLISNNAGQANKKQQVIKMFRFVSEISEAYFRKYKTKKFVMSGHAAGYKNNTGQQPAPDSSQITAAINTVKQPGPQSSQNTAGKRELRSTNAEMTNKIRKDSDTPEGKSDKHTSQGMSFSHISQGTRDSLISQGTRDSHISQGTRDSHISQGTGDSHISQGTRDSHISQGISYSHQSEGNIDLPPNGGMIYSHTSQGNKVMPLMGGMGDVLTTSHAGKITRDSNPTEGERDDLHSNATTKDTHATRGKNDSKITATKSPELGPDAFFQQPNMKYKDMYSRNNDHTTTNGQHDLREKKPGVASSSDSVDILLFGSTGNGKSATGNSILGKPVFKISTSTTSSGRSSLSGIVKESNVIEGVSVSVVDGPGVYDSGEMNQEALDHLLNSVEQSMELCGYNFCALLIVLRFGVRFTKQEVETINVIKSILGENVIKKYGICIITHGDSFDHAVEEAKEDGEVMTFESWCRDQAGDVKNLFEECDYRCVLFDNKTKDPQKKQSQFKEIMALINPNKKYSKDEFVAAGEGLKELTLKTMAPQIEQDIRDSIKEIEHKLGQVDSDNIENVENYTSRVRPLLHELNDHKQKLQSFGHGFAFVDQLSSLLTVLEMRIQSKIKQQKLMAETRRLQDASSDRVSSMLTSKMEPHDFMDKTEFDKKTVVIDANDEARMKIKKINEKLALYVKNIEQPGHEFLSVSHILDELLALKLEIAETIEACGSLSRDNTNVTACSNLTSAGGNLAAGAAASDRYNPFSYNYTPSHSNQSLDWTHPHKYNQDPKVDSAGFRNTEYVCYETSFTWDTNNSDIKTKEKWKSLKSFIRFFKKFIPEALNPFS